MNQRIERIEKAWNRVVSEPETPTKRIARETGADPGTVRRMRRVFDAGDALQFEGGRRIAEVSWDEARRAYAFQLEGREDLRVWDGKAEERRREYRRRYDRERWQREKTSGKNMRVRVQETNRRPEPLLQSVASARPTSVKLTEHTSEDRLGLDGEQSRVIDAAPQRAAQRRLRRPQGGAKLEVTVARKRR